MWGCSISAAVEKSTTFLGVSMEIDNHFDLFLLMGVQNLVFYVVNLRI